MNAYFEKMFIHGVLNLLVIVCDEIFDMATYVEMINNCNV